MTRVNCHPRGNHNHVIVGELTIKDQQLSILSQTIGQPQKTPPFTCHPSDALSALEVLEAAREGPETMSDPRLAQVLNDAFLDVWGKIMDHPSGYVMTRDEFAIFNFFQYLRLDEAGTEIARKARANYWSSSWGPPQK
ncbi:uncharacterized protein GGS22DRAFT_54573 [Annulohypoxylon maeteangense]|uniref:uncharacterized protein n=1 Tax=Annulohypoxylon maeteangense TaxID=1927788 RepID=UPI00200761D6|nr:uncharacterized protein GGS22DRAFT_54573 [Annulohypoxylon maeteangense]KAI0881647.1 hypothetical protein GGS22DRAFT_54573 [Annulohypoxylon maeteangense]